MGILLLWLAEQLPSSKDIKQVWRDLTNPVLPNFVDRRHGDHYEKPDNVAESLLNETLHATDIVFVNPLYWYNLPAPTKLYLDHWSHWMRLPEKNFRERMAEKRVWHILTHSGSEPKQIAPAIDCVRFSAEYLKAQYMGALIGHSNFPGDIEKDASALVAADRFFGIEEIRKYQKPQ